LGGERETEERGGEARKKGSVRKGGQVKFGKMPGKGRGSNGGKAFSLQVGKRKKKGASQKRAKSERARSKNSGKKIGKKKW